MENIYTSENSTSVNLDELVHAERLQLLYHQSFPAIFISLFTGLLLTAILWPVQQKEILISWIVILAASAFVRFTLFILYWKKAPQGEGILAWETPYFFTLTLSSLIWGLGAVFIIPVNSELYQTVTYFFLMGMAGGALSVYSAHRAMTLVTIATVLLPITIWFISQGKLYTVGMGVATILFFLSAIRAGKVLSSAMHQSFKLTHELKNAKDRAEKLARIDVLTGLNNRRAFYEKGQVLADLFQRNNTELSMIVMDIDNFKNINDTFGHTVGDETLKKVGQILQGEIRKSDVCARIGGEEFGILLQVSSPLDALNLAEKLRGLIANTAMTFNGKSFNITASFGVASCTSSLENLFKSADKALYEAKDAGRNCVISGSCLVD